MKATTAFGLLAALASSAHAAIPPMDDYIYDLSFESTFIGTFDAFKDTTCNQGAEGITINTHQEIGALPVGTKSVKAYIQDTNCHLMVWSSGRPEGYPIPAGDNLCVPLSGYGQYWRVICSNA